MIGKAANQALFTSEKGRHRLLKDGGNEKDITVVSELPSMRFQRWQTSVSCSTVTNMMSTTKPEDQSKCKQKHYPKASDAFEKERATRSSIVWSE